MLNIHPLFSNTLSVIFGGVMEEKVKGGQLRVGRGSIMSAAATGIATGGMEDFGERDGFRRTFLELLVNRMEEIERSVSSLTNGKKEYSGLFSADEIIEELDLASLEIAAQTHFSILERKNKELKKIKILIHRARHEEEFGLCENCGRQIPEGRLLVVPEATLCVSCQNEMEQWESRRFSAKKSHRSSRRKRGFELSDDDNSIENEAYVFRPGSEYSPFEDLDMTDLDYNPDEIVKE